MFYHYFISIFHVYIYAYIHAYIIYTCTTCLALKPNFQRTLLNFKNSTTVTVVGFGYDFRRLLFEVKLQIIRVTFLVEVEFLSPPLIHTQFCFLNLNSLTKMTKHSHTDLKYFLILLKLICEIIVYGILRVNYCLYKSICVR